MSEGTEPEASTNLFTVNELPKFDLRQAWNDTISALSRDHLMNVGDNEVLRIPRRGGREGISRRAAELGLIREVIQTGTVTIPDFQKINILKAQLTDEYSELLSPDSAQHLALDYLNRLDESAEIVSKSRKIARAAGYIAARQSLWVVTKVQRLDSGDKNVAIARLVGLAKDVTEEIPTRVLPVVSGRNNKSGVLMRTGRDKSKNIYPKVLDVFEGSRKQP